MVFKYLTFTVEDNFLNTRPGSPPAFPPSPSVASPRACSGCMSVLGRFGELQLPDRFRDGGAVEEMLDENGSAGKGTRNAKKQSAGIPCEGNCWASADGSSQEEGQKNAKGRIGLKTKTGLVRPVLSSPIPPDSAKSGEETARDSLGQNDRHHKLLLVGFDKSGTSTIFKQAKILYGVPFSEDERQKMKLIIQSKLYCYLGILLEGRERFEEETLRGKGKSLLFDQPISSGCKRFERGWSREKGKRRMINRCHSSANMYPKETILTYSMDSRLKRFSDRLLKVIASANLEAIVLSASCEFSPFVEELWKNEAIQATYNRRNELEKLPRVATFFLERAVEILKEEYEPSDMDILYAEGITSSNGLASMEFSFPTSAKADGCTDSIDQCYSMMRCQLIRVHPRSLGENCKRLEMFEDVNIVLFCVSLTDYDEFYEDNKGLLINKMMASKELFESVVTHPTLYKTDFLLIMNKLDLLEEKIEQSPLTQCEWFCDFHPVISSNRNIGTYVHPPPSLAELAYHYIAVKFKRLFHLLTKRKLYVSQVTGLEQENVDESLKYAREIMNWDKEDITFINEESSASLEVHIPTLEPHTVMGERVGFKSLERIHGITISSSSVRWFDFIKLWWL